MHNRILLLALLLALLTPGCSSILGDKLNPAYCAAHPTDVDCMRQFPPLDGSDDPDGPTGCTSNTQCASPMPVCLVDQRVCVQCTENDETACTGATPACEPERMLCVQCTPEDQEACVGSTPLCGDGNACRACGSHDDCPSSACLPTGACGDDSNVAYVDPAGTGSGASSACSKASPCVKVDDALKTGRPFVKFHGLTNEQITLDDVNVTFLADPSARLTSTSNGILLKIDGTSQVTIYDLEIGGASGPSSSGISLQAGNTATVNLVRVTVNGNSGSGVNASGGALTISQSTFHGNAGVGVAASGGTLTIARSMLHDNLGGGMSIENAAFAITNNLIYRNGNGSTAVAGGIELGSFPANTSRLEFNTIVDNQARVALTSAGGIICDQTGFVAAHNIVFRNQGGATGNLQSLGVCTYADSYVMPGSSNVDNTPGFASPNTPPFDYHLSAAAPATIVDAAGTCSGTDIDGDQRPAGTACDLGADERRL